MRISWKVYLVGGIPIAIAAAIAFVAWMLLSEAERARTGAALAGATYRDLLVAMAARDDYVAALAADRRRYAEQFATNAARVRANLNALAGVMRDRNHRAAAQGAEQALDRYVDSMRQFVEVTTRNDALIAEMTARAASLIALTDQARARQHSSNADIVASLTERDRRLRAMRDVLDRAQDVRAAIADLAMQDAMLAVAAEAVGHPAEAGRRRSFALVRMRNAAAELGGLLQSVGGGSADELKQLTARFEQRLEAGLPETLAASSRLSADTDTDLVAWVDRLLKVTMSEQRAIHDEVAQLLTYSVQAAETEQATQNIAIATLKLGQRTSEAFARRDPAATAAIHDESANLGVTVAGLPISPLIQTEMIDALDQWREGLGRATEGLRQQNAMIADMDRAAATMIDGARSLNDMLAENADRIGAYVRNILVLGAAIGLLFGGGTALIVAGSITRPLQRLQDAMRRRAADPAAGAIPGAARADELGDIARAANYFVTEMESRETAVRQAKDRADAALAELQQAQADLIQAEKLASLGQLVAGVAHEINTPLGVALTTATALGDEASRFGESTLKGPIARSQLARFIERMNEGARLLFVNLARAADLVQSFKQVAVDQASGERRRFDVQTWLHDLLTSLGPLLRRSGHTVSVDCRPGLTMDSYPGALAQVLTNLIMNALVHAYDEGQSGKITIAVSEPRRNACRIVFADDGKGIAAENLGRVFDPFFTTGRSRGSTGLGLHIVFNLVTGSLQGRIDLASAPGMGTRFTIDLPLSVADHAPERLVANA